MRHLRARVCVCESNVRVLHERAEFCVSFLCVRCCINSCSYIGMWLSLVRAIYLPFTCLPFVTVVRIGRESDRRRRNKKRKIENVDGVRERQKPLYCVVKWKWPDNKSAENNYIIIDLAQLRIVRWGSVATSGKTNVWSGRVCSHDRFFYFCCRNFEVVEEIEGGRLKYSSIFHCRDGERMCASLLLATDWANNVCSNLMFRALPRTMTVNSSQGVRTIIPLRVKLRRKSISYTRNKCLSLPCSWNCFNLFRCYKEAMYSPAIFSG